jgi:hypothetical protein
MVQKALLIPRLLGSFLFLVSLSLVFSCNNNNQKNDELEKKRAFDGRQAGMDKDTSRWLSWNVLVTKPENAERALGVVEDSILKWIRTKMSSGYSAKFDIFFCPCDSLLYNLAATPLDGAGNPVVPPSTPNPPIGGSGDWLASVNNKILDRERELSNYVDTNKVRVPLQTRFTTGLRIGSKVLAIIDTGIDTLSFPMQTRSLIWQPSAGSMKLFNYLGGAMDDFRDDNPGKHGTSVSALSLWAMGEGEFPRLMILKALDRNKTGSSFTVSCALSYAVKNKADVVNASLGFYERTNAVDSVLRHYLVLCSSNAPHPIFVFAAAGNDLNAHNLNKLCDSLNNRGKLEPGHLFYPACFHPGLSNVISVTGLTDPLKPCTFQNYSDNFVKLGVQNAAGCCRYYIPFLSNISEGSSFATPVATGMLMRKIMTGGAADINAAINTTSTTSAGTATIGGRFMLYTGNPAGF